jgi:nanoRNase/pAp phosphatase (c-di-AMP/oligoRNAs hydrolase)
MQITEKTHLKFNKLIELIGQHSRMLIVLQDNPDPDAIAAASALRKIANSLTKIKCSIAHGGTIGRAENRALVNYLNLNLHNFSAIDFSKFDLIAMVDAQPATGNTSLPEDIIPDIVIDHHPARRKSRQVQFTDIRSRYGAASTILLEYLIKADIPVDMQLATVLLYGIRSDTQDLGREAIKSDIEAIEFLYPFANKRMLSEIQRGSVPREYFQMLEVALKNARIYGNSIITSLGAVTNPDMISEVADLLLREDKTTWTMCSGVFEGKLLISIRAMEPDYRADKVIKRLVSRKGTGGGHMTYAGGQIPLRQTDADELMKLERYFEKKFLRIVGSSHFGGEKLTP